MIYYGKFNEPKQKISGINTLSKFSKKAIFTPIMPLIYVNLVCESESIAQGRSYSQVNLSVSNCFFSRSSLYSGHGGVIFVDGGSYSINVNYSMFYNCACSNHGGAIYFNSINSFFSMNCANGCSCGSSYYGHFGWIYSTSNNSVIYLSITNCSYQCVSHSSIELKYGFQIFNFVNSSKNYAAHASSVVFWYANEISCNYCTFSSNIAGGGICIQFSSVVGTIYYINFIDNNSPTNYGVILSMTSSAVHFIYGVFAQNHDTLFEAHSTSTITLSSSFIGHSGVTNSGKVTYQSNNSFIIIQTYQIQFFNSYYCIADLPLATPLRTNEQTPLGSPQMTLEMTKINTHDLTPYRSFEEHTPHQSLFPDPTPPQTLFPEYTPHQSLYPNPTPFQTHYPERTNHRSFPVDFVERTPLISIDQSNNNLNENTSNSVLMYSAVGLLMIIVVMISYIIGSQRNQKKLEISSSSLEMKHQREETDEKNERNQKQKHHEVIASSPYVF